MKFFFAAIALFSSCIISRAFSGTRAGFYLPDSVGEVSVPFRSFNNLVILPVVINDSVHVNLVLDTGCRNLVLFGEKFRNHLKIDQGRTVSFSGLGDGKPLRGSASFNNKVSIDAVLGEHIPIVVVPDRNLFGKRDHIDGVIGYDVFIRFEIELQPAAKLITFRPAVTASIPVGYTPIPLKIEDSRPVLQSTIQFEQDKIQLLDVMIDTGSSLGLLLKTTDLKKFERFGSDKLIGRGLNGALEGTDAVAYKLTLAALELTHVPVDIVSSPWQNYASIGMLMLKDYVIILNYCKAYACIRKIS